MSNVMTIEWNVRLKQDTPDRVLKTLIDWHEYTMNQGDWLRQDIDVAAAFGSYFPQGVNGVAPSTAFDLDAHTIKTVANFNARDKGAKRVEQLVLWLGPWIENSDDVIAVIRSEENMFDFDDGNSGFFPHPPRHGFTEVRFTEGNPHIVFTSGDLHKLHPWVQ